MSSFVVLEMIALASSDAGPPASPRRGARAPGGAPGSEPRDADTTHFFVLAFALTWACQLPGVFALLGVIPGPPERYLPLVGLGAFGPLVAACFASRVARGGPGVRALFARLAIRGVGLPWFVVAPFVSGAIFVVAWALYVAAGGSNAGPALYLPVEPERIVAMIVFSVGEEVGWRGYAMPRLEARYGALRGSVILGVLWGIWHVPMFVLAGVPWLSAVLLIVLFLPAGSVVFGWFFARTNGHLLVAILLHVGAHLNNSHRALPASEVPVVLHTIGYVLVALLLVLFDRDTFDHSVFARQATPVRGSKT